MCGGNSTQGAELSSLRPGQQLHASAGAWLVRCRAVPSLPYILHRAAVGCGAALQGMHLLSYVNIVINGSRRQVVLAKHVKDLTLSTSPQVLHGVLRELRKLHCGLTMVLWCCAKPCRRLEGDETVGDDSVTMVLGTGIRFPLPLGKLEDQIFLPTDRQRTPAPSVWCGPASQHAGPSRLPRPSSVVSTGSSGAQSAPFHESSPLDAAIPLGPRSVQVEPADSGYHILHDNIFASKTTGSHISLFGRDISRIHHLMSLHGLPTSEQELRPCRQLLASHLLSGACFDFHLHSTDDPRPDGMACLEVSQGFYLGDNSLRRNTQVKLRSKAAGLHALPRDSGSVSVLFPSFEEPLLPALCAMVDAPQSAKRADLRAALLLHFSSSSFGSANAQWDIFFLSSIVEQIQLKPLDGREIVCWLSRPPVASSIHPKSSVGNNLKVAVVQRVRPPFTVQLCQ
ncbi:hypothetical protein C8F01DRAFT_1331092 [Mycena amicta]|nr:hypothetical protein C8F01DRAFT_1331092 [Mycena amicta]